MNSYLSISNLSEYFYCPRSFIYMQMDFRPLQEQNYFIMDGRLKHAKSSTGDAFFNRRGEKVLSDFFVFSRKKKIMGKADRVEIINKDRVRIIEEKRGRIRSDAKIEWQLRLLSYCYAEMYPEKSIESSIYFIDSRRHKKIEETKEDIEKMIDQLRNIIKTTHYFEAKRDARCSGCMYEKICG